MTYPLLLNATLCCVMGCTLLLAWRRDQSLRFASTFGAAYLLQMLVILAYWLSTASHPDWRVIGNLLLPVAASGYATLMVAGVGHLSTHRIFGRWIVALFLGLAVINATALFLQAPVWAHAFSAVVNTMVGTACTCWFLKNHLHANHSEKWIGPLLIALGLNQFIFVAMQKEGGAVQATVGSLLHVTLGLVLLYAAMQRTSAKARQAEQKLEYLKERMLQGVLIVRNSEVLYANPACLGIYGVPQMQDLTLDIVLKAIPRAEQRAAISALERVQNGQQTDARYEGLCLRKDNKPMWLGYQFFQTEWAGVSATQILISDDIQRHENSQALLIQALHDDLTGLPNRVALLNTLRERCESSAKSETFVLILIDIDRFKLFNEAHGHSLGDEVLKAFAHALRAVIDPVHGVLRLGGDEFALVSAPDTDGSTAVNLASAVRQLLSAPLRVFERELFIDASMGIALYPHSARGVESLLRAANAAMHVAKLTPGTSHKLAEKEFERGSSNALEQEQALRTGIENNEFHLVFQPKVNAQSGQLTSFEALACWSRPGIGQISPIEFIAASERTGLISTLGTALLKQACRQIAAWHAEFDACVPVAVNVSPLQLLDPGFPTLVGQILKACDVEPRWLTLEITESSAMQNLDQTILQVAQLHSMGVHVAMDDFGTGFSSLNMLRTLRLHTVKIDRSLITPLPSNDAVAVVNAICQLAQALQLTVVAEGVETEDQATAARNAGCTELQGFLYAMPLTVEDAAAWLQQSLRLIPAPQ
jgi:diguanylate cyclase (GGDEF)-like protein